MFQMMSYPNRTHSISEGEGTFQHLAALVYKISQGQLPAGRKNGRRSKSNE